MLRLRLFVPEPLLLLSLLLLEAHCIGTARAASKRQHYEWAHQGVQASLQSIEDRLRSIDVVLNPYTTTLETKLDQVLRKLDSLEAKITRMESVVHMGMDKISENVSNHSFKDDINKDQIIRRIDSSYERINHRLLHTEMKMEMNERKTQDKMELILSRQQKLEDSLVNREADLQMEIGDAIAAIDDTKTSCGIVEENIRNISRLVNASAHATQMLKNFLGGKFVETVENVTNHLDMVEDTLYSQLKIVNVTVQDEISSKSEFREEINDYANKLTDMFTNLWEKNRNLEQAMSTVSSVQNSTRNELQNGLRNIIIQVGKKSPKTTEDPNDSHSDANKLAELEKLMETNFDVIKEQQNLFLESCHRVQMDESQLESHISVVLEKLVDVIEQRSASEKKELKSIEHLVKAHDGIARKNNFQITNHITTLMDKTEETRKRLDINFRGVQSQLNDLVILIQDHSTEENLDAIQTKLQVLTTNINSLNATMHSYKKENSTEILMRKIHSLKNSIDNLGRNISESNTKNMHLTEKINEFNASISGNVNFAKTNDTNTPKSNLNIKGSKNNGSKPSANETNVETTTKKASVGDLILAIFGSENSEKSASESDIHFEPENNCTTPLIYDIDVRFRNTAGCNNTVAATTPLPIYDIDVRFEKDNNTETNAQL